MDSKNKADIRLKPERAKPKVLDAAAKAPKKAAKNILRSSKDKAATELKDTPFAGYDGSSMNTPATNAADNMLSAAKRTAEGGASSVYRGGKRLIQHHAKSISSSTAVKKKFGSNRADTQLSKNISSKAQNPAVRKRDASFLRNVKIKGSSPMPAVKGKTAPYPKASRGIRTFKTAPTGAVKSAPQAARNLRVAASKSIHAARSAVRWAKGATVSVKALIAAIAAGGSVAVTLALLICMIGMVVASGFGIFYSIGDFGEMTLRDAVRDITYEYTTQIQQLRMSNSHDILEMSGTRSVWPDVLAVYSVKTAMDPNDAQEVSTMNPEKAQILADVFWQMNLISVRSEIRDDILLIESNDDNGNIITEEVPVQHTYLYIDVAHKTVEEMADLYGFDEDQRKQLNELLSEENAALWSQVLYGIGDGDIVNVALSQVGNIGGEPYWSWYGFTGRVDWCACFVSWCANECDYISSGIIPKFSGCISGSDWFKERGLWEDNGYTPNPGDIIFFDWDYGGQDGLPDHVGIVEKVENGRIYTIEGNSDDSVRQSSYPVGYYEVYGFGVPNL
jgi:hypothetical protein